MKTLVILITIIVGGYGLWMAAERNPLIATQIQTKISEVFNTGLLYTLEIRYSASQIMEEHQRELLKGKRCRYLESVLEFYPYLLIEAKYTDSPHQTDESAILWDLTDGEMVVNTKGWEKTHGFSDCIRAHVSAQEFKILHLLFRQGGSLNRRDLSQFFDVDDETAVSSVESCLKKKLVIQTGNRYRLHFQKPRFHAKPRTFIDEKLVIKPFKSGYRHPRHFSASQIEKIAHSSFGPHFVIRHTRPIYLPVHHIVVQHPDGSIHTTHWNGVNGQRMFHSQFID